MLIPRRTKWRKQHRPHRTGFATGGTELAFGDYGIQALEGAYVTNRQIEAARIAMTRHVKRGGKVWIYKGDITEREFARQQAEQANRGGRGRGDRRNPRRGQRGQQQHENTQQQAAPAEAPAATETGTEA